LQLFIGYSSSSRYVPISSDEFNNNDYRIAIVNHIIGMYKHADCFKDFIESIAQLFPTLAMDVAAKIVRKRERKLADILWQDKIEAIAMKHIAKTSSGLLYYDKAMNAWTEIEEPELTDESMDESTEESILDSDDDICLISSLTPPPEPQFNEENDELILLDKHTTKRHKRLSNYSAKRIRLTEDDDDISLLI
jgi:hypothetical protein